MTSMLGRKFDLFMTRDLGMSASVEGMPCGGCGTDAAVRPSAYDPFFRLVSQKCKGAGKFLICQTDGKSTPHRKKVDDPPSCSAGRSTSGLSGLTLLEDAPQEGGSGMGQPGTPWF
jgi:hypothetical protein